MFPITVVKRFLNRNVPNIPLPPNIDDDLESMSGSWIVPSKPTSTSRSQTGPSTVSIACQTSFQKPSLQVSPRSRPRDFSTCEAHALPPPKFRMKSKPPTLHLGGLDAPVLHPFASPTIPKGTISDPPILRILQASAKCLPSPARFHHPTRTSQTTEAKESLESNKAKDRLKEIFYDIGFSSKLFCEIHDSQFADQHIDRIGESLGTGGLLMYLQVWHHWACWCHLHSAIPAEAPLSLILDYLHASDLFKKKKNLEPSRTRIHTSKLSDGFHLNSTFRSSHISRAKLSLIFSNQRLVSPLRDPKPLLFHLQYLQPGRTASLTETLNLQKSLHLDVSSLLLWLHSDSVTFSGQNQVLLAYKDTSSVASRGEQKHQYQANHGEFAA